MEKISASLEDYLEGVHFLYEKSSNVRVRDLAEHLGVTGPSVVKSLIKLKDKGFITQEPYGNIELTPKGKSKSEKISEKHKVLKSFFKNILDIDEKIAEEDACKIEHVINTKTYENLTKLILFMGIGNDKLTPEWLGKFKKYLKTGIVKCQKLYL